MPRHNQRRSGNEGEVDEERLRASVLAAHDQYMLQIKSLVQETAKEPHSYESQVKNQIIMNYANIVAALRQILNYDYSEVIVRVEDGVVMGIEGLPNGVKWHAVYKEDKIG